MSCSVYADEVRCVAASNLCYMAAMGAAYLRKFLNNAEGLHMPIDRLDAKLLNLLQTNNRRGSEDLGEVVGLSSTAVQRRL